MNIIDAIINIANNPIIKLRDFYNSNNRANNMGYALEEYIKDVFANTFYDDDTTRNKKLSETFSYLGNTSNPPDAMLRNGDAIEVKKLEGYSAIQLNSSYPKHTLKATNMKISSACRNAEKWTEKDIIYAVGTVKNYSLQSLCMVYGMDYCASDECYKGLEDKIKDGIERIENIELEKSNELGHINRVDPLGITYMRIRGMWGIENPWKVFGYIHKRDKDKAFSFMSIINEDKWNTFDNTGRLLKLANEKKELCIKDVAIKNPDNPAKLCGAKLVTFEI